ncbi:MAG: hypothetical protein ABSA44_02995 [Bacteroidota bacterium]
MKLLFSSFKRFTNLNKFLLLIIFLFVLVDTSLYLEFMPDDTFIHIGYAKDICEGNGYSFAGNKTYGSTSPLWPPCIAALTVVRIDLEHAARLLSFLFSIASICLMYHITHLRFSVPISLGASCLLCFNTYFLRWSLTGMEATAACFFMLVLIYLLFKERQGSIGRFSYLIIGLSPLVRPEYYLFVSFFFMFLFFNEPVKKYAAKLFIALIPSVIWNCFAFVYYGTIVPTTFSIKAGDTFFSTEWDTFVRSAKLFLSGNPIELCVIFLAFVLLLLHIRHTLKKKVSHIVRSEVVLIIIWIVSFYLYYILKNVTILSRYSLVVLPLIILLMIDMFTRACEQYHLSQRTTNLLLAALVATSLLVHGLFTYRIVKPDADSFTHGFQREYKKIASILSAEGCTNGSVALSDVGIIGVYSGLKIYDFVGLVDKDRFHFSSNRDYFINKKPQYLISHGEISLEELKDTSVSFQEIYTTQIAGLGINQRGNIVVHVHKVFWR